MTNRRKFCIDNDLCLRNARCRWYIGVNACYIISNKETGFDMQVQHILNVGSIQIL